MKAAKESQPRLYPIIGERPHPVKKTGAYGTFTLVRDLSAYTCAKMFHHSGRETQILARFGIFSPENGCADTEREAREFSVKFFTEDGNLDIPGMNIPVSISEKPSIINEFYKLSKRDSRDHLQNTASMWNFFNQHPESMHYMLMLMSDRGTPRGYRRMDGYGVHTYRLTNAAGEEFLARFHFKPLQEKKTFTREEAEEMRAEDMDFAIRDFVEAVDRKDFPRWDLFIQIMSFREALNCDFDPFDSTLTWPKTKYAPIHAGTMELNAIPENFYAEVQYSEFSHWNNIEGVCCSGDKNLFNRTTIHSSTPGEGSLSDEIREAVISYELQKMSSRIASDKNPDEETRIVRLYEYGVPYQKQPGTPGLHYDRLTQPRIFLNRVLDQTERACLTDNIAGSMNLIRGSERNEIIEKQLELLNDISEELAQDVSSKLSELNSCIIKTL